MKHADLDGLLERMLSVEQPRRFKPDRSVYSWAAGKMGVAPDECMLVAAHGWDIAGAQWAGLRAAFIAREGHQLFPLAETPEIETADLLGFTEKLFPAPANGTAVPITTMDGKDLASNLEEGKFLNMRKIT